MPVRTVCEIGKGTYGVYLNEIFTIPTNAGIALSGGLIVVEDQNTSINGALPTATRTLSNGYDVLKIPAVIRHEYASKVDVHASGLALILSGTCILQ